MTAAPTPFDLCGPLPQGTTVLEASAGTGKTHAIAGLAVRYLAEGAARIDQLMLVTFGRAATVELRERVRTRRTEAAAALENPPPACDDVLLRHLVSVPPAERAARRERVDTALANFDAATINTTHGFCRQMLAGLGVAADQDPHLTFMEDTTDLLDDVVTDLLAATHGIPGAPAPQVDAALARKLGTAAVTDPAARLEPADADDALAAARYATAVAVRGGHAARKRAAGLIDFNDLLVFLRDALADPHSGPDACRRVRARYRVVMVDEFQDTDPVQWEILERAFHGHRTLVLIGDPKQAIYAFRGADVETYLLATRGAHEETLGTNWRSDRPLVEALGLLWNGVALGSREILVRPVEAHHARRTLVGSDVGAPLRIRVLPRSGVAPDKPMTVGVIRPAIAADVAADLVRLLSSGAEVLERSGPLGEEVRRAISPGDIAVLVPKNKDGRDVRDALHAADVPVVLTGTSSVFLSAAAAEWLALLNALGQPARPALSRAVALTDFVGWSAAHLAAAPDAELDDLALRIRAWAAELAERGVAALMERIWGSTGIVARVLAREDGERHLTDLRHGGEALHAAALANRGGVAFLTAWLRDRIRDARTDPDEERSRRLETDAQAVQVITIHRAKGLEFPVVYAPSLWDRSVQTSLDTLRLHDGHGRRILDVGGATGPDYGRHRARHWLEEEGESLRLAYVALTRARSQVGVHWAPSRNTAASPLHRLLFAPRGVDGTLGPRGQVGTDDAVLRELGRLAAASRGRITIEPAGAGPVAAQWRPPAGATPSLAVRDFDRRLDRAWSRVSYTALTAAAHAAAPAVPSEPEAPGVLDEPDVAAAGTPHPGPPSPPGRPPADPATALLSPLGHLPGGTTFGTVVHAMLEAVDFTDPGLAGALARAATAAGAERLGVGPDDVAHAMLPALRTPLGALAGGRRLVDVAASDRLNELEFELPLAGGDTPHGGATLRGVADLLHRHLPADDPLAGYAADLAALAASGEGSRALRGFLTGSIDAVLRVRDGGGPRFVVVDYKTNWLGAGRAGGGPDQEPLTAWDYRGAAMAAAMRAAHYPLQALLYSAALHRFLRWRLPGYAPDTHLGGVLYLFVRGLCGPGTPVVDGTTCGVFQWRPPAALVTDLSDLLDDPGGSA